jgi:hypothetical protein
MGYGSSVLFDTYISSMLYISEAKSSRQLRSEDLERLTA